MVNIKQNYPTISQSGSGGRVIIIISPSFRRRVPFGWAESRVFLPSLFRTLKSKNKNKNKTWDPGVKRRDGGESVRIYAGNPRQFIAGMKGAHVSDYMLYGTSLMLLINRLYNLLLYV